MTAKDILETTTMSPETREFIITLSDDLYLLYGDYNTIDDLYLYIIRQLSILKRKCEKYDTLKESMKSITED